MSKQILFIIESLGGGGTQSVVSTLINEWNKKNIKIHLLTFKSKKFDKFFINKSVKRFIMKKNNKFGSLILRFFNNLIFIYNLRMFLKKNNYDFILSFITATNLQVLIASIGLKNKIIVSERNDIDSQNTSFLQKILRKIFYKYSFLVTSNIENNFEILKGYVKKNKLIYLPNPLRLKNKDGKNTNKKEKIILSIGRLNKQKGYNILLHAFNNLLKVPNHESWKLYILGEGPERKSLEFIINNLGISKSAFLLGYKEPTKYLKIASVYVQSSIFEGMPNSVLEAMEYKVPTVLNNKIKGIKFLAKDKFSCLYFDNSEDDLFKKLLFVIKNINIRKKLTENAFQEVQKLDKNKVAKIWLEKLKIK